VIIGVIAVAIMQPAIMHIIHVRAVLHHGVFFTLVPVGMIIAGDAGDQLFVSRIDGADGDGVFINMAIMALMKMAIVEVINMPLVIERGMAASCPMGMGIVARVNHFVRSHRAAKHRKRGNRCKESYHGESPFKVTIPRAP
jgi:hypothetical protein